MSLVEWGKAVHARFTEILCRQRIVFHHVPKCGGTSVGRALRRAYILSQGTVTPEASIAAYTAVAEKRGASRTAGDTLQFRELMLLYLLYSDVRCVSAHIPFSDIAHEQFHGKYLFVTLLREPVDRFISHYRWSHSRPHAHGYISEDFADFLSTEKAKTLGSSYVRYFLGRPLSQDDVGPAAVDAAVRNLHRLDHVGFLDEMEHFELALENLTGKRLKIGRENVGSTFARREDLVRDHLSDKILAACAPDREIWDAVQDLRRTARGAASAAGSRLATKLQPMQADL